MVWVKLATGFFSHPKARAVGKDGRELFLASCCWTAESGDDGLILTRDLPVLAALAEVKPSVAKRLVDVDLWEVHPDGWLVHDYLDYNPSAAADREMRRKRADAGRRGGQNSKPPPSKPEANASANGEAKSEAEPKQTANPYSSSENSHPQTTDSCSEPPPDDDEPKQSRQERALAACNVIGDQRLQAQVDAGKVLVNANGYRRSCRESARTDHLEQAQLLAHDHPDLNPADIAAQVLASTQTNGYRDPNEPQTGTLIALAEAHRQELLAAGPSDLDPAVGLAGIAKARAARVTEVPT